MSSSAGGTTILDRDLLLKGLEDRPWFEKNIPLLEIPDRQIQEVYYYRWQTYKEHLVYTGTEYGYMASEFLSPVSYGAPYGGIVAAAGHHITEGLYWQVPVWDATEFTAAFYESSDPYHGGAGFRPTINSYQYGDAIAIAKIAALGEDPDLENEYRSRAERLRIAVQKHLWDDKSNFYKHQARDDNPSGSLLGTREIMGYLPWMFAMPCDESQFAAFSQLKDPQGFFSNSGPTTAERRSKWFMHEAENCCRWDGPSWPFATSQTLTAVENVLQNYPAQSYITAEDYYEMLHRYARTQYEHGQPYVAEAHHPDEDRWMYDGYNHSEDYNHSTFVDNVLAGLIGLRAQSGDEIVVNPLTPSNWNYFAVENVAYHSHSITVLWDKTGSVYNRGQGLRVYVDGQLARSRETIGPLTVEVGPSLPTTVSSRVNIAANSQRDPRLPLAFASYTSPADDPMRAINGMIFRTGIPQNSRWTSYNSPNPKDNFGIDLRKVEAVDNVRLFFYDDSDGVRIPASYDLQYWTGDEWITIPDQVRSPMPISSNAETKIKFPSISTSRLRVEAPNAGSGVGWGLSEFEIWT
ncbi:hypothetical protein H9Q74_008961 [Fusarium xylarioides]|nr:hypothetical protein H9Q71_008627 [Fusarium xylarioides]KAG5820269.1 hypothetical protein H9Q74_008961 [Fusarium xylarioides]